jgi:hypothetical protein
MDTQELYIRYGLLDNSWEGYHVLEGVRKELTFPDNCTERLLKNARIVPRLKAIKLRAMIKYGKFALR